MTGAWRPVVALVGVALGCGALLSWVASMTQDRAAANREAAAWREVFTLAGGPFDTTGVNLPFDTLRVGDLTLSSFTARGYGGAIYALVAIEPEGSVRGVRVLRHQETPGLGDFIDDPEGWLAQFRTRSPSEVDVVTGATITSRALIRAIEAELSGDGES